MNPVSACHRVMQLHITQTHCICFDIIYSVHFDRIKHLIHATLKCTLNTYIYTPIWLLHVSASFTSSSGSPTPGFKTYCNTTEYNSNSYYVTVFLQLILAM